jgi:hypothetical protein
MSTIGDGERLIEHSATDEVVLVFCNDSAEIFKIYEPLLKNNTRFLRIDYDAAGQPTDKVDASSEAFHCFTQWLYRGITLRDFVCDSEDVNHGELSHGKLIAALDTHRLSETVGCFDFMDMILDGIIDGLPASNTVCSSVLIKAFAKSCAFHSGGSKLAIDILLHTWREECGVECADRWGLGNVNDHALVTELARKILAFKGYGVPEDIEKPDYCEMVIVGFLEANRRKGGDEAANLPWSRDRCQYHRHRELGLPCYKEKAVPKERMPSSWMGAGSRKRGFHFLDSDEEED